MTIENTPLDQDNIKLSFGALRLTQPIGDLYLASIPFQILKRIAYFDVRRVLQEERDVEKYLGIQRPLNPARVEEISKYVNFDDATFPTAVIIAIDDEYVSFDEEVKKITVRNYRDEESSPSTNISRIAKVIDGQHRIAGLYAFDGPEFDVPVSIFIGSDISDQAYVFATVNLEQNKVSRSLAYDLFELAKTRSPQRTCHELAVVLDQDPESPFFKRIKRLGIATPGRKTENISQATFVESLMRYISDDPKTDRDLIIRNKKLEPLANKPNSNLIFRDFFRSEDDIAIGKIIFNYFSAVRTRWPVGWDSKERGIIISKTSGFRAFMRALGPLYKKVALPGNVPSAARFYKCLQYTPEDYRVFSTETYPPGTSGEAALYRDIIAWFALD